MKKILICLILFVLIATACELDYNRYQQPVKNNQIKIGLIAPLTGPFAEWGQSIRKGLEIALTETKHEFVVDYEDSACDPRKTLDIANKFFEIDQINLIIGPGCVTGLKAIIVRAEEKQALLFSTGLLDDQIFKETSNVINLANQISVEGKHMAKHISSQGVKKIAIVHGTNLFGLEYAEHLPKFLKDYNINITSIQPSELDTTDFKDIILKAIKVQPDAIFIHQAETKIGLFVKQMREMGFGLSIYSYYGTEADSVLETGDDVLEGIEYSYPINSQEDSIEKVNFEQKHKQRFGENANPSATSLFVYDGLMILDKALDFCKPQDIYCIKRYFVALGDYVGLSGDMQFDSDGSIKRPFGIKRIEKGEFVWVDKEVE